MTQRFPVFYPPCTRISAAVRFAKRVDHRDTEEATKSALVLPFIQMLGYEIFDPTEVVPEYTADVGTKKGENVDYALMQNGKPAVLVECKKYVSPIILTKGLEFDAVIVANARKDNFNETDFDRKLLYLACTRARHQLEIHWYGTRSSIVPDVARLTL